MTSPYRLEACATLASARLTSAARAPKALFRQAKPGLGPPKRRKLPMDPKSVMFAELPMRLLVVEDDEKIATFVVKGLKQSGFAVDHAKDGEEGLDRALVVAYDAAILDLMLPKLDGLSMLRELRRRKLALPVLILSARASVDDRVT